MEILVISPLAYALEKQTAKVQEKLFVEDLADCRIHKVQALPDEYEEKINGHQYDYMWIDTLYSPAEVGRMREHLSGLQSKQIERF